MENNKWDAITIKNLRNSYNLTQAEFAFEIGCRSQTVSEWELGKYTPRSAYNRLLNLVEINLRNKNKWGKRE